MRRGLRAMPTFKAIVIRKTESGQTAELTDFDEMDLMEGDVALHQVHLVEIGELSGLAGLGFADDDGFEGRHGTESSAHVRSEERRVGKEGRVGRSWTW